MGGILRALRERGVFRGRELAVKPVKQAVDPYPLTVVELHLLDAVPEPGFFQHGAERDLGSVDGAAKAAEKPFYPRRHIHGAFLGTFQDVVIAVTLLAGLGGHAVKALRAV